MSSEKRPAEGFNAMVCVRHNAIICTFHSYLLNGLKIHSHTSSLGCIRRRKREVGRRGGCWTSVPCCVSLWHAPPSTTFPYTLLPAPLWWPHLHSPLMFSFLVCLPSPITFSAALSYAPCLPPSSPASPIITSCLAPFSSFFIMNNFRHKFILLSLTNLCCVAIRLLVSWASSCFL